MMEKTKKSAVLISFIIFIILLFIGSIIFFGFGAYYNAKTQEFLFHNVSNSFYAPVTGNLEYTDNSGTSQSQVSCPVGYNIEMLKSAFYVQDPNFQCTKESRSNFLHTNCADISFFTNPKNICTGTVCSEQYCNPVVVSPIDNSTITVPKGDKLYTWQEYSVGGVTSTYCLPIQPTNNTCPTANIPMSPFESDGQNQYCADTLTCSDTLFTDNLFINNVCGLPTGTTENYYGCSPMRISTPFLANICNGATVCASSDINPNINNYNFNHGPFPCNTSIDPTTDCTDYFKYITDNGDSPGSVNEYCNLPKTIGGVLVDTTVSPPKFEAKNITHGYAVAGLYKCIPTNESITFSKVLKSLF